jgi:hypothetical protein
VLARAELQSLAPLGFVNVVDPFQHDTTKTNGDALPASQRARCTVELEGLPDRCWNGRHPLTHHDHHRPP